MVLRWCLSPEVWMQAVDVFLWLVGEWTARLNIKLVYLLDRKIAAWKAGITVDLDAVCERQLKIQIYFYYMNR